MNDHRFSEELNIAAQQHTEERDYWLQNLGDVSGPTMFPADRSGKGDRREAQGYTFTLPPALCGQLLKMSKGSDHTLHVLFCAACAVLLSGYADQEQVLLGAPIYRKGDEMDRHYINSCVPLNVSVSPSSDVRQLLMRTREVLTGAMKHYRYPIEILTRDVLGTSAAGDPSARLFDVAVLNTGIQKADDLKSVDPNLVFLFSRQDQSIDCRIEYNGSLYLESSIQLMAGRLTALMETMLADVSQPLAAIDMMGDEEKQRLLVDFNDTERQFDLETTIQRMFVDAATKHGAADAVVDRHGTSITTYSQLHERSDRLGRTLLDRGVGRDSIVALMADPAVELVVGILAILKAGAAYMPVDPGFPKSRRDYMLQDSRAGILLTQGHLLEEAATAPSGCDILNLDDEASYAENGDPMEIFGSADHLLYVIYTSGTTGKPKGVQLSQFNLVNYVNWFSRTAEICAADRTMLVSSFAFDLGYTAMYPSLLNGAALHLLPRDSYMAPDILLDYIGEHGITYMKMTPSMFNVMVSSAVFTPGNCGSLRLVVLGGEAIIVGDVKTAHGICPHIRFMNHYGPTEATIGCIARFIDFQDIEEYAERPTIGVPIANTRVYIVDRDLRLRSLGLPGELCIAGNGLARGYLNKPEVTVEKFVDGKITAGETVYRTGDLARFTEEGLVEFLGRVDHQVKIRGYRIELGEIEQRLGQLPQVTDCVVIVKGEGPQDKYIAAYIVPGDGAGSSKQMREEIRAQLSLALPEYMIPAFFVFLDQLPLTANGKVDRKALPEPELEAQGEYVAPHGAVEEKIAGIWGDLLDVDPKSISSEADFFQIGGNSLRATVLVGRMHREFEVTVPLNEVFRAPTVQGLAAFVQSAAKDDFSAISPVEKREYYPLSSAQKRLYFLQRMDRESAVYNMPRVVHLGEGIDCGRVEEVFRRLSLRHESFRTSFETVNDEPVQRIHDGMTVPVERFDGVNSPYPVIRRLIRPFDLEQAPLVRAAVLSLESGERVLFVDTHHIISDGVSVGVLINEFHSLLAGETLTPNPVQYKDYAVWHGRSGTKEVIQQQEDYWLERCTGEIPVLALPYDFPRPAIQSFAGAATGFNVSSDQHRDLRQLAEEWDVTMFMLLFAIFNVLLQRLSNQDDILVGTPVAGRRHADLESVIGMFVNTLVIRLFPEENLRFDKFLQRVKETTVAAFDNQDYQFEELVDRLEIKRDAARNPLFDVMFVMQNAREYGPARGNRHREDVGGVSRFDITWSAREGSDGLTFGIEYCTKLFKPETIRRFMKYFQKIIHQVVENRSVRLGDISLMDEEERSMLLERFNRTAVDYPRQATIFELFHRRVSGSPDRAAVYSGDLVLTYNELERQSGLVASQLSACGCGGEEAVGVMTGRNAAMAVAVLGILRAGGAYMPVNADYPPERIAFLLKDSGCRLLLADCRGIDIGDAVHIETIVIPADGPVSFGGEEAPAAVSATSSSLAYIIFTSGSTGAPKGVMVEQKNVVRLVQNTNYCLFEQGSRILQTGALEFDASTLEIWGSLLNGLTLCLAPKEEILSPVRLKGVIRRWDIDIMWMTVALFNQMVMEDIDVFRGLRQFFVGGDALSPFHVNRLRHYYPSMKVTNGYGPTENTTFSTTHLIHQDYEHSIPIGAPIANSTAYILDRRGNPQPLGIAGELYVGGDGVARGYMNQPFMTAEKFAPNPFLPGTFLYRTGDSARYLADGAIEFLGRLDFQVKIRGFRIELGEIENRLLSIEGVDDAVVLAKQTENTEKYLCGYVVTSNNLDGETLKLELGSSLPDYMVPSVFMFLDAIPLTSNGKVDRRALPQPEFEAGRDYAPPTGEVEEALVEIWSSVLGIDRGEISATADFFDLGGHSLRATILVGRIHRQLDVEIPLTEIFRMPTIRELGAYIEAAEQDRHMAVAPVEKKDFYPVTSAQRRLFILQRMDPGGTVYNIPGVIRLQGPVNPRGISDLFQRMIDRHESFRTSFTTVGDEPVQRVADKLEFQLETVAGVDEATLLRRYSTPFDLGVAPLLRVVLATEPDGGHLLLVDMHHIISDGTSMDVLTREFDAMQAGRELPDLRVQYKDFAEWRLRPEVFAAIQEQQAYWRENLEDGVPALQLPYDFPRPAVQSFEGALASFRLEPDVTGRLLAIGRRHGATLFMVLLALYNVLLSRLSGQEDLTVGTPVAGRRHADLEPIIGMFVNTLVQRNVTRGRQTFTEFLSSIKQRTLEAFENQDAQFEELVERLVKDRDAGRNPLFDTMFVLQNTGGDRNGPSDADEASLGSTDGVRHHGGRISKFDMTWTAVEQAGGLLVWVEYCTRLFERDSISRFVDYFKRIALSVAANPDLRLEEVDMLSEAERRLLLVTFNDTDGEFDRSATIHDILERHVQEHPDRMAVVFEDRQLTYSGLMARAGRLAACLRAKGAGAGSIVAIHTPPSLDMMVGIIGVLRAGAAFLPIDHNYPASRALFMVRDSGAVAVVVGDTDNGWLPEKMESINLNDPQWAAADAKTPAHGNEPEDPAYVIYTSGSTGRPKGVVIEHRPLMNLMTWQLSSFSVTPSDHASKYAGFSFDASIVETFPNLVGGGVVVVVPQAIKLDLYELNRFFDRYCITISFLPTQLCEQYMREYDNSHLRILFTGGDALREFTPRSYRLVNVYGPSENAVSSTISFVDETMEKIHIGGPMPNTRAYILGSGDQLQPVGVPGELCVGGAQLARGYLNRPELTAEKFVEDPFRAGEWIYRTGDLARWLPDGNIDFIGRLDFQVKIRGMRIELGEIENQLLRLEDIGNAVVLALKNAAGENYLCAYVVAGGTLDREAVRLCLGDHLPDYMIPEYFMEMDSIPLTANGKVDRKALPQPELATGAEYVAPEGDIETALTAIWAELLGIEADSISVTADFFRLGGHSLRATILAGRIHRELNVHVPVTEIFTSPTIRGLARFIRQAERDSFTTIPAVEKKDYYPVSSAQSRLYVLQQMDVKSTVYNIPYTLRLPESVDTAAVAAVFNTLVQRHESFRSCFTTVDDAPVQRVLDGVDFSAQRVECDENTSLEQLLAQHIRPFDLSLAPLLRVALAPLPQGGTLLLVDMHHIVSDGASMEVLSREFLQLYERRPLPDLRIQYKDFAQWQSGGQDAEIAARQREYWLGVFGHEIPVLSLPYDLPRPEIQSFAGAMCGFRLSPDTTAQLRRMADAHGATLFIVLLGLFNVLMAKLSGDEDIVVGTPVAGRRHADLESIIGMFVNTLALRNIPGHDLSFSSFLRQVKERAVRGFENQDLQFEELVEHLAVVRDAGRNPIFDVMLALQNTGDRTNNDSGDALPVDFDERIVDFGSRVSRFDMTWTAAERGGRLDINVEYCTKLFKRETIHRFIGYFRRVVEAAVSNPERSLASIEIMSDAERERILYAFNDTAAEFPSEATVNDFLDRHLELQPDFIAAIYEDEVLTYGELLERAECVAGGLRELQVGRGDIVAVLADPSVEMLVGVVAVLRSGAAFLPVDHTYPQSRMSFMIKDSGSKAVVCLDKFKHLVDARAVVSLDRHIDQKNDSACSGPGNQPEDTAYVIYTSGSTGKPKGVMIQHRSLLNLAAWHNDWFAVTPRDRASKYAGFGFDASIFEIFPYLVGGAAVAVVPDAVKLDMFRLNGFFDRLDISVAFLPTQVYEQYAQSYDNTHLRVVLTGGDKLREFTPRSFRLVNDYGPTENTVVSTSFFLDFPVERIPIGKPVPNTTAYILGPGDELRPVGVPGELCVGGEQLARGYLNRPELTAEKFVAHPFSEGETLYRTGDLARWLPGGDIEFMGRIDSQVKIRGLRIELGEIESQLLRLPGVRNAVVAAWDNGSGDKYLCGYVVAEGEFDRRAAGDTLAGQLPDYMVPGYFVQLDSIPLTPNGKVDRRALPEPEVDLGDEYIAPVDDVEKTLVVIWADILGIDGDSISTDAGFFQLGGHSLRATILVGRIRRELQVEVPLSEVFRTPTIQGLATFIRRSKRELFSAVEAVEKREYYPLSPAQERLFILQQMDTQSTVYNVPSGQRVRGKIDPQLVERTFALLVERHESFRTFFTTTGEHPVQRIHDTLEFHVQYSAEAGGGSEHSPAGYLSRFIKPFDLRRAPLLRVGLVKLEENDHLLLMDMHHIISDGSSMEILAREFFALLDQQELPEMKVQYKDFAVWQQTEAVVEETLRQRAFWLDTFAGEAPVLSLPFDYPRPEFQSFEGAVSMFTIGPNRTMALNRLAAERGGTLFMVLQAVFMVMLSKLSGQEDIVVGTPVAGRRHPDLEGIVGMFVNTLALRQFPGRDKLFSEFLDEVKERTLQAFQHQDLPFEDLVESLSLTRDAGRNPLFDVMMVLQNTGDRAVVNRDFTGDNGLDIRDGTGTVARFDMTWTAAETGRGLEVGIEYCTHLFNRDTIYRFIHYFSKTIDSALASPDVRLGDISILSTEERRLLLEDFNDTATGYPRESSVHELFERQVRETPDWAALVSDDLFVSYRELHCQSDLLAAELRLKGCVRESVVAVMMGRTSSVAVALLAILKSGGGYMPISSDYPPERIAYILDDSGAGFLITDNIVDFKDTNNGRRNIIRLRADNPVTGGGEGQGRSVDVDSRSLAYILYTSGSTGMPKGVMVEHRSVVRLVKETDYMEFFPRDRFLQTAALEFDVSTYEFWGALLNGITLCVAPLEQILSPRHIKRLIRRLDIGTMWMTVALFNQMSQDDIDIFEGLRRIISGGDALSPYHINRLRAHYPDLTIINGYGPTENTCYSTTHTIHRDYPDSIPIGRPIANSTAYVVDRDLQLCPVGVAGELCVGGDGVARGYLNRPELTAERFVDNPHKSGDRLYHTGDLSRYRGDGILEFFGRLDFQVKIRGFRVELGEIENQLLAIEGIDEAVVLAKETDKKERYLCAYAGTAASLDSHVLKEELGKNLPDFMVPSYIVLLDKLPINHNGKVDRRALPEPQLEANEKIEAPETETERRLAALWSEVLGIEVERIGVTSAFFDIGGHSLKGMQLATKVRREFGVTLPLVTIFRRQTIRAQAQFLDQQKTAGIEGDSQRMVALKEVSPDSGNLFFVHDGTGEVDGYIECVDHLELDLNCWGIRAAGLEGLAPDNRTIGAMAEEYIDRMKAVQPQGPYMLLGWSLGGTVAFEIARRLEKSGETVSQVLLVDAPPPQMFNESPAASFSHSSEIEFLARYIEGAKHSLKLDGSKSLPALWKRMAGYLKETGIEAETVARIARNNGMQALAKLDDLDIEGILYYMNLGRSLIRARSTYEPEHSLENRLYYIAAKESETLIAGDWSSYCRQLVREEVDGDHYSIFKEPNVLSLCAVIRRLVEEAQAL
jgi:tyrocidine synthetase-3